MEFESNGPTSLMSQIEALIAPPSYETSKTGKKGKKKILSNRDKTYSRCNSKGSGKGNQKFCSACLDGGDLICCDQCPAAFHLLCINPPMDDELPAGDWLCNRCRMLEQMSYEALDGDRNDHQKENSNSFFKDNSASNSNLRSTTLEKSEKGEESGKQPAETAGEAANGAVNESEKAISDDKLNDEPNDALNEKLSEETMRNLTNSIDLLIRAATLENPKQFQLPLEYTPPIQLPGTSRKPYLHPFAGSASHVNSNKQSRKKAIYEPESGGLQIPFKTCFKCDKNCRRACLIQCDYCPLLYHLDCLDPPLTCPPLSTRWMCPNHVEQVLEQKLLTSSGLSERVKLWNTCTEIHGETVKLNFIRKASRRTAPYRVRVSTAPANLVRVPEAVKQMYRRPVDLIPSENVLLADRLADDPTDSLNRSNENRSVDNRSADSRSIDKSRPNEQEKYEWLACLMEFQNSVCDYLNKADASSNGNLQSGGNLATANPDTSQERVDGDVEMQDQLSEFLSLDQDQIRLLAWEKYKEKQLIHDSSTNRNHQLSSSIINNSKDDASIDTISLPDDQSLTYYYSKANAAKRKETEDGSVRAQLCPIIVENHLMRGGRVPMRRTSLRIGTNSSMDLNLLNYGHCNHISDRHAMIFFDEDSKHFELINYSEFGTVVDKVRYSCDYLTKRTYSTGKCKDSSIVSAVKSLIKKSRRERAESSRLALDDDDEEEETGSKSEKRSKVASPPKEEDAVEWRENYRLCHCDRRRPEEPSACGWEGSAILNHGSFINFGCLEFTFSVTDFGVDYGYPL